MTLTTPSSGTRRLTASSLVGRSSCMPTIVLLSLLLAAVAVYPGGVGPIGFAEARRVRLKVKGGINAIQKLIHGFKHPTFGCENPLGTPKFYTFDPKTSSWGFRKNNCNYTNLTPKTMESNFKGKTILFIGDSTVRNVLLSFFAAMCNPVHMMKCSQRVSWPFQDEDRWHGMNCGNHTPENTCNEIKHKVIPLPGLTEQEYYMSREERTLKFWKMKKVPPMLRVDYRGIRAYVIEAGCHHPGNAVHRVLWYLVQEENKFRQKFPDIDVVVSGGGMHCSLADYVHLWHSQTAFALGVVQKVMAPTVWLELPHCLYFTNITTKAQKFNYASCSVHSARRGRVQSRMNSNLVKVSPTRFISRGTVLSKNISLPLTEEEEKFPCVNADDMHPGLKCYQSMLQVHLNSMLTVMKNFKPLSASERKAAVANGDLKANANSNDTDASSASSAGGDNTETIADRNSPQRDQKAAAGAEGGGKTTTDDVFDVEDADPLAVELAQRMQKQKGGGGGVEAAAKDGGKAPLKELTIRSDDTDAENVVIIDIPDDTPFPEYFVLSPHSVGFAVMLPLGLAVMLAVFVACVYSRRTFVRVR